MVRAPLFVPATRPVRFAKAAASGTDAVIVDLEDAVAPVDKDRVRGSLRTMPPGPVILRINAIGTAWHEADLAALDGLNLLCVMMPKAEDPAALAKLNFPLLPLIETARGLAHAREIAALPNVTQLAFGSIDFCADLGMAHLREVLLPVRLELVLASRLAGIAPPLDGVTTRLDPGLAADDATHARNLGMGGKLCIHPSQVEEVRTAFLPTEKEREWAQKVLASGGGAVAVDGEMVDEPVRRRARNILSAASKGHIPQR